MGATLSSMNAALKRVYSPDNLVEQLFQGNEFLDMLEKGSQYKLGEVARVVIHKTRNGGTTFLPDGGGTLNTAGNQGIDKAEYNYKHSHQQIAIQEDVLESTGSNAQAVADVLDVEVSGALNDLRKQLTRTVFGNGDSLICGVQTANSTTITLQRRPKGLARGEHPGRRRNHGVGGQHCRQPGHHVHDRVGDGAGDRDGDDRERHGGHPLRQPGEREVRHDVI
jgi:hypothetical protein